MAEVLDVAYAIHVERNERIALALITAGHEPSLLMEAREALDADLCAAPRVTALPPDQIELRRALGVA